MAEKDQKTFRNILKTINEIDQPFYYSLLIRKMTEKDQETFRNIWETINEYNKKSGCTYADWYIGRTNDLEKNNIIGDPKFREFSSSEIAQAVVDHFKNPNKQKEGYVIPGSNSGGTTCNIVYAYIKMPTTNP